MKPRLVLAGLGHGQLELLDRLGEITEQYDVTYIGSRETVYTGAFPQVLGRLMSSATVTLPGVQPIAERLLSVDPVKRRVLTEKGIVPYDLLVLATGARSRGIGTPLKPMTTELIEQIQKSERVTVVGGGKAGVELAFVCARSKAVTLYARNLLPESPYRVSENIERQLVASGVTVVKQKRSEFEDDELVLDATGVVPVSWWARSGLTDPDTFIKTDDCLRHVRYPEIFVTGDMNASLNGGVDAVRSGRYVASVLIGETDEPFKHRRTMNILLTTPGKALLTFGRFAWHGRIPYWIKRIIDTNYVRRFN